MQRFARLGYSTGRVRYLEVPKNDFVSSSEVICSVETEKAVLDMRAETIREKQEVSKFERRIAVLIE